MVRTVIIVLGSVLVSAAQTNQPVELPQGEGKEIIEGSCSGCHGLTEIAKSAGFTEVEWRKVLQAMVQRGAQLNDQQLGTAANYLANNFGQGRKILDTKCTTCHTLDEVKKFRGFFKKEDWQDVVTTMIKYGADLGETEPPVLVEYLTRVYGPAK